MRRLAVLLAWLLLAPALAPAQPLFSPSQDTLAGARVFDTKGERGKVASDLTTATVIDTPAGVLSALWSHSFIADPRVERDRTPWPVFRGEDVADLVAYLRSLRRAN